MKILVFECKGTNIESIGDNIKNKDVRDDIKNDDHSLGNNDTDDNIASHTEKKKKLYNVDAVTIASSFFSNLKKHKKTSHIVRNVA